MNSIFQFVAKSALTFSVLLLAVVSIRGLWRTSIDFRKVINPVTWFENKQQEGWSFIPSRRPDTIYQNGEPIAKVDGVVIDKKSKSILFLRVTAPKNWTSNRLGPDGTTIIPKFEYLDFVIQYKTQRSSSGAGFDVMEGDIVFEIIGKRAL